MNNLVRSILPLAIAAALASCGGSGSDTPAVSADLVKINGEAQGTTYVVSYLDGGKRNFKASIDSILATIDASMSTYVAESVLLTFNAADSVAPFDAGITKVFEASSTIYSETGGAFDPTVLPVIAFWGFGSEKILAPESINMDVLDSIRMYVGLDKVSIQQRGDQTVGVKSMPGVELNFNAIAQGYSVDVVCDYLHSRGIDDYLVEIGGEVRVAGKNAKGKLWSIGIDKPQDESQFGRELQAIVSLDNRAVATSGNYRKYYVKDGVKYSHTIDPKTGFPVQHSLLSATVVAENCMLADGYATAFMVMGLQRSQVFLSNHPELEGYLIYADASGKVKTYMTEGLEKSIEERE